MNNEILSRLELPRTLVNQLLHSAQSAPAGIRWGVIGARGQTAAHCHPIEKLDAAGIATAQRTLAQHAETLFALYRTDTGIAPAPDWAELEAAGVDTPLLLDISLGTRGVLQLRGWQRETGRPVELEIGISET